MMRDDRNDQSQPPSHAGILRFTLALGWIVLLGLLWLLAIAPAVGRKDPSLFESALFGVVLYVCFRSSR